MARKSKKEKEPKTYFKVTFLIATSDIEKKKDWFNFESRTEGLAHSLEKFGITNFEFDIVKIEKPKQDYKEMIKDGMSGSYGKRFARSFDIPKPVKLK